MNSNSLRNYITSVAFEGDILTLLQAFVSSSTKDVPAEAAILLLHMLKTTTVPPQAHASGFSPETMRHLSDTRRLAHQLRDVCASQVAINAEEAKAIDDAWSAAHAQQTRAWAEDALYRARNAIKETRHLNEQYVKGKKQVFNHEYTPLLEKYFEHNAYPTAPDRAVLARKCMMTPRQIEVWFQNHRNRAKKEGKILRRLTQEPLKLEASIKALGNQMPFFMAPPHERQNTKNTTLSQRSSSDRAVIPLSPRSENHLLNEHFTLSRPPYAFPTVYTRQHMPNFLEANYTKFPPPVWLRKPATGQSIMNTSTDMDRFIEEFAQKLHLRGPVSQESGQTPSWCATRTVIPCSAPHPALIQLVRSPLRSNLDVSPSIIRASCSPILAVQALDHPVTPTRRKVTNLPKRTPKNPSVPSHASENLPKPSNPSLPTIRSPSSASDTTSRRSSISSIRSSSSSSGPSTPVKPSATLLNDDLYSISINPYDSHDDVVAALTRLEATSIQLSLTGPFKALCASSCDARTL